MLSAGIIVTYSMMRGPKAVLSNAKDLPLTPTIHKINYFGKPVII